MTLGDLIRQQAALLGWTLHLLETGSIRGTTELYELNDGWSTVAFAELVKERGGSFASVDRNTDAAAVVLEEKGLSSFAELCEGYSVDWLAMFLKSGRIFNLVLLDSDNDSQLIFDEFLLAQHLVRPGGTILIDDCAPGHNVQVKGHKVLEYLERHELAYEIVQRGGDQYETGVLVYRLPL